MPPPPGTEPCLCPTRRLLWARLERRRFEGCCGAPCCRARLSTVLVTGQELYALRAQAMRQGWRCPRCGLPVSAHQNGFQCVDETTRLIRAWKERRAWERARR